MAGVLRQLCRDDQGTMRQVQVRFLGDIESLRY